MVTRDARHGIEVLMLRRTLASTFVAGAFVFPGGAVDEQDRTPGSVQTCRGRTAADADDALGSPNALAWWTTAVRECFEESGILLARTEHDEPMRLHDEGVSGRFDEHRRAVHAGDRNFCDILCGEGLHVPAGSIHPWSRWVTPIGGPRRYDTRFFVCEAPGDQTECHDTTEMMESRWFRPIEALDEFAKGAILLILPTVKSLQAIARFDTVADLLAAAQQRGTVPAVLPRLRNEP